MVELARYFCSIRAPGQEADLARAIADIVRRRGVDAYLEDVVDGRCSGIPTANGGVAEFGGVISVRTAHISRTEEGASALTPAIDIARGLRQLKFTHQAHLVVTRGIVAAAASVGCDLRTGPGMTGDGSASTR